MVGKKIVSEIHTRIKYVRGKKGKLEKTYRNLKAKHPQGKTGKIARVAGLGAIDLSWFLFCLGKYTAKDLNTIFIDNSIIDKFKEKNKKTNIKDGDSEFKQFFKKLQKSYPNTAARLKLWTLYGLLTIMSVGGVKFVRQNKDNSDKYEKEQFINNDNQDIQDTVIIYNDKDKLSKNIKEYDISSKFFRQDFMDNNWNDIVIGLLEFETWYDKATQHSGESRYTYASGLTWVYAKNKKGKWIQHPCSGKYVDIASNFDMNEKWEQAKCHCDTTVYVIKRQLQKHGFTTITDPQTFGLLIASYQLSSYLRDQYKNKKLVRKGIIHKLKEAESDTQKQIDAFIAGNEIPEKWRAGTNKRRWWSAMIYMGYITSDDLIDLDRDAFSSIDINTVLKNGHFVYDTTTIEYVLATAKNPNKGSVRNFINKHKVPLKGSLTEHKKNKIDNKTVNPSMEKAKDGLKAFNEKDYKKAIECYQLAISLDVDNMEAYRGLALAYKNLGDQTHSVSDYEKVLDVVKTCNTQMNKNRNLLYDPEIKALTYYNAGLAREEIAKLKKNDIETATENYRKAKLNFKTAYANAKEIDNTELMEIYQNAQKRIDTAVEGLKTQDNIQNDTKEDTNNKTDAFKKGRLKILERIYKPFVRKKGNSI